jgi:RNA polymerase sigma-70 factor (ECF subfamily)
LHHELFILPGGLTVFTTPPSLLERLRRSKDQAAWEQFVDMYTPLLFSWVKRLGLPGHENADLIQDLFTTLVEKLPAFHYDPSQSFRAWLKTILLNRWRNWQRRCAAERRAVTDAALADRPGPEQVPDLEEAEYRAYLARRALELMQAEFEPSTWKACWEFVVSGRSAAEVAAELGISVNAVYLAKGRVLRRLREELAGLLG